MIHIIAIDDDESDRILLTMVVSEFAEITAFEDPNEALLAMAGAPIFPDLILVDARLGKVSGFEVARRIRIQYPHANIVLMSGCEAYADKEFPFMLKPIDISDLAKGIRRHLNGTQPRR